MKNLLAVGLVTVGIALSPITAVAQERLGDGAMGAVAGAIVGGPIGAVAGGLVGYTAGPNIARGLGIRHHYRHYHHHYANRDRDR
jgi:hypothetical protein